MRVLMVFDLAKPAPERADFTKEFHSDEWESEANVFRTLRDELGHSVEMLGLCRSIEPLLRRVSGERFDVLFNLAEAFDGDRSHEPDLASLYALLGLPYTGANPAALRLCKDKAVSKAVVFSAGLKTPRYQVFRRGADLLLERDISFPVLVKPLALESSMGISEASLARDAKSAMRRVAWVHERLKQDAIVEQYIEGREIYFAAVGDDRPEVFAPRELFLRKNAPDAPRFATYRAKWDDEYRKRWRISSGPARPAFSERELEAMKSSVIRAYEALGLSGYARMDFRLSPDGELYFLEANPNPSIGAKDDFAQAAASSGWSYARLLDRILNDALGRVKTCSRSSSRTSQPELRETPSNRA